MYVVRRARPRDPGRDRVQQEMEDIFRALLPGRAAAGRGQASTWRPPLEVYELDTALVVRAEIAGMNEAQLQVVVDGDVLMIRGEREAPRGHERRSYYEANIPYGEFGADIFIPFSVDADRTSAEYHNGFLHIVLPRASARTIIPRTAGATSDGEEGEN